MTQILLCNWTIAQSECCVFCDIVILNQTSPTLLSPGCLVNNAHNEYLRNNFPFMTFFISFHLCQIVRYNIFLTWNFGGHFWTSNSARRSERHFVQLCYVDFEINRLIHVYIVIIWRKKCIKKFSIYNSIYNAYFLKSFVGGTLFSNKSIIFRCLNLKTRFLTIFSGQCLISRKPIFLGYLKPHQASWWLILKLISMLWQ